MILMLILLLKGFMGLIFHRSNPYTESYYVDKWSAGCQVFKKVKKILWGFDYM